MKFSVITCTYNNEEFLRKNIESVALQTHSDIEHIFIDAFSADGTTSIIDEYIKRNPERAVLFQCEPQGISHAMNEGIKRAQGDYVIHLHADDSFVDGNVLRDVAKQLELFSSDFIYGKICVVDDSKRVLGIFPEKKMWQYRGQAWKRWLLRFYNYIPHQAVFIKKSVFEKYGLFDESISSAMDPDMWLRITPFVQWQFFDRVVSNFCIRKGSQSADAKNRSKNKANWITVQKRFLRFWEIPFAALMNRIIDKRNNLYR